MIGLLFCGFVYAGEDVIDLYATKGEVIISETPIGDVKVKVYEFTPQRDRSKTCVLAVYNGVALQCWGKENKL